ncbi:MAG: alcohol dehydrogenase, partial [Labilithrix sp.]|nr:alcohol dehydrogenase [Labilithrix sp.]
MSTVTWSFPTTVVFGTGSLSALGDHVRRANGKRALVVCDPGVVKAQIAERVRKVLEDA